MITSINIIEQSTILTTPLVKKACFQPVIIFLSMSAASHRKKIQLQSMLTSYISHTSSYIPTVADLIVQSMYRNYILSLLPSCSITDAFNETKDKVKYLETLHKYFDQLSVGNSIVSICSTTMPGLMASVRQLDAISRYYARSGYLGFMFSKVCIYCVQKNIENQCRSRKYPHPIKRFWFGPDRPSGNFNLL